MASTGGVQNLTPGSALCATNGCYVIIQKGATLLIDPGGMFINNGSGGGQTLFISSVQIGTGSPQDIAHTLGVIPAGVIISPYNNFEVDGVFGGQFSIVEGSHTAMDIVVTATASLQYKILAYG